MAHRPIIEVKNLGRFDTVEIGPHQQGVLYKKRVLVNTLQAHQTIGRWDMSTGDCTLYVLDCRPHQISWRVDLPTKNRRDHFPFAIELTYEIRDGHKFIDSGEQDTEKLIEEKLKPELRRITRSRELKEYRLVETEIEEALEETRFFEEYGLFLHKSNIDVMVCFSDEELAAISGQNLPQQIRRTSELPSVEPLYPFMADVVIKYEVVQEGLFAKAINDAVEWIWQVILNKLRAASAGFRVNQLQEAQASLRRALENEQFLNDGVRVESAFVKLSLGDLARAHAVELDKITRGSEIDKLADLRRIDHLNRMIQFFEKYLPPDMKIMALGMGADQVNIREAVERMDKRRQEQLTLQMKLLEELVKADALPEVIQAKAAEALMGTLAGHAMSGLGLPEGEANEALPEGEKDTAERDAGHGRSGGVVEEATTGVFTTHADDDEEEEDDDADGKSA